MKIINIFRYSLTYFLFANLLSMVVKKVGLSFQLINK